MLLKKYSIIGLATASLFLSTSLVSAANTNEEVACFQILAEYVKKDARFGGEDISKAHVRPNTPPINLAAYDIFLKNRQKNSRTGHSQFLARRNNIGTLVAKNNYLVSQIATFGQESAFKFPYPLDEQIARLADDYGDFRDKLVYTHHIAPGYTDAGALISCGFLKVTPAPGKTHQDTHPQNYKTNTITRSGFGMPHGPDNPVVRDGKRYLVGIANVPINNWNDKAQMTLELVTVAYDNQSVFFNEFETFPLQYKAMTDLDNQLDHVGAINKVQERFLELVQSETCLGVPHTPQTLPAKCGGAFKSLTKSSSASLPQTNILGTLMDILIPSVSARMEFTAEEIEALGGAHTGVKEDAGGLYVTEVLSYENKKKLDAINNPTLTQYITRALSEDELKIIQKKIEN